MTEEEDKKPSAREVLECLKHDLDITEDKEKYKSLSTEDLRDCMANIIATLIFMFELLSGGDDSNIDAKEYVASMFS